MSLPRNGLELGESGIAAGWAGVKTQALKAIIEIYEDSVILSNYEDDKEISSYEVSATSLTAALSGQLLNTGLLPRNILFWSNEGEEERLAVIIPAGKREINASISISLPNLILLGSGAQYWIFACKEDWPRESSQLYNAPLPNIYGSGRICQGDVAFPAAGKDSIEKVIKLFFESRFNSDLMQYKSKKHPTDIYKLYNEIKTLSEFPLEDLIQAKLTVGELINANPAN